MLPYDGLQRTVSLFVNLGGLEVQCAAADPGVTEEIRGNLSLFAVAFKRSRSKSHRRVASLLNRLKSRTRKGQILKFRSSCAPLILRRHTLAGKNACEVHNHNLRFSRLLIRGF